MFCNGMQVLEIFTNVLIPIKVKYSSLFNLDLRKILAIFFCSYFSGKLLIQHGDIESNPGPSKKHRPLTCCHWNVKSDCSQDAQKIIDRSI